MEPWAASRVGTCEIMATNMRSSPGRFALALLLLLAPSFVRADEPPPSEKVPDGHLKGTDCVAWIETTYRLGALIEELRLDLEDRHTAIRACIQYDTDRMHPVIPFGWCDNVFKVHCSGIDLLTEIGETQVQRCEEQLGSSLGVKVREHQAWRKCAENAVFDGYALEGKSGGGDACRAALLDQCGTNIDAEVASGELSSERRAFVECCSAEALDPERGDASRCGMIDSAFSRGPCRDRPVCINRLTSEWLTCA